MYLFTQIHFSYYQNVTIFPHLALLFNTVFRFDCLLFFIVECLVFHIFLIVFTIPVTYYFVWEGELSVNNIRKLIFQRIVHVITKVTLLTLLQYNECTYTTDILFSSILSIFQNSFNGQEKLRLTIAFQPYAFQGFMIVSHKLKIILLNLLYTVQFHQHSVLSSRNCSTI